MRSRDLADSIFEFLQIRMMKCEREKDVQLLGRTRCSFPAPAEGKGCDLEHRTSSGSVCWRNHAWPWGWCCSRRRW